MPLNYDQRTVTINDVNHRVAPDVADLLQAVSEERDALRLELAKHVPPPPDPLWIPHPVPDGDLGFSTGFIDPHARWSALATSYGCIDIRHGINVGTPRADIESMHICDLDDFIDRMLALRDEARKAFPEEFGEYIDYGGDE